MHRRASPSPRPLPVCLPFLLLLFAPLVQAAWPTDPQVNLAVAVKADEQVQPKVVPAADGGWYVSWFDNDPDGTPAYGYDVFLQRLGPAGDPQWAPAGVRIADRGLGWTMDYALGVDPGGNAVIAFNDDRLAPGQITVVKVDPSGGFPWGANGVAVSRTREEKGPPRMAVLSDGAVVVAWSDAGQIRIRLLNAEGRGVWEKRIQQARNADDYACDLQPASDGGVLVSWTRQPWIKAQRHLLATKLSRGGKFLWDSDGIPLYDDGEVLAGNFPEIVPDDAGGAVFAWQTETPEGDIRIQRVTPEGAETWAHGGLTAAFAPPGQPTTPVATWDPLTKQAVLVFRVSWAGEDGLLLQRFDPLGNRAFPDPGTWIQPMSPIGLGMTLAFQDGLDTVVTWWEQESYGLEGIAGARVSAGGLLTCPPFPIASYPSGKMYLSAALDGTGATVAAWSDGRDDFADVYAQRVTPACALGGP